MWNASEAAAETGGALATGGATALLALKSLADLCLDFEKLCRDPGRRLALAGGPGGPVEGGARCRPQDEEGCGRPRNQLIDKAESALAPLGPKIDVVEKTSRAAWPASWTNC